MVEWVEYLKLKKRELNTTEQKLLKKILIRHYINSISKRNGNKSSIDHLCKKWPPSPGTVCRLHEGYGRGLNGG
jgi:hypothetical protein